MTASAPPRTGRVPATPLIPTVEISVTDEVDKYTGSIAGVEIEAVLNGHADGPNSVVTVREPRFTMTSSDVRMPLLSHTTVGDDTIAMTYIKADSQGSRWCGVDLEPGSLMIYGPSAEHSATTRPGLSWACAITDVDQLAALAEQLEVAIESPARGEVRSVAPCAGTLGLGGALCKMAEAACGPSGALARPSDDVLHSMVLALADTDTSQLTGVGRGIDSRAVTALTIEYARALGRIPSLGELCIAAHVSERRLRKAFVDEYEVPPARFFRTWALAEARRRLLDSNPMHRSVADVAAGLGFFHLGRFASYYRNIYDEPPSATLHIHR